MQPPTHTQIHTHISTGCISSEIAQPCCTIPKANKPKTRESLKALCETLDDEDHAHTAHTV